MFEAWCLAGGMALSEGGGLLARARAVDRPSSVPLGSGLRKWRRLQRRRASWQLLVHQAPGFVCLRLPSYLFLVHALPSPASPAPSQQQRLAEPLAACRATAALSVPLTLQST